MYIRKTLNRINNESRKMSLKTCSVSVLLIVVTLVDLFFQGLVSVNGEILQVKQFGTFMNYCQDASHQYVSSITQLPIGLRSFPL